MIRQFGRQQISAMMLTTAAMLAFAGPASASTGATTLPAIFPTPVSMTSGQGTITLGRSVVLVAAPGTDPATTELVRTILTSAGVETIATARRVPAAPDRPHIVIGGGDSALVRNALALGKAVPDTQAEGYTIASVAIEIGRAHV